MSARQRLIEKLSDTMDPENAARFVDEAFAPIGELIAEIRGLIAHCATAPSDSGPGPYGTLEAITSALDDYEEDLQLTRDEASGRCATCGRGPGDPVHVSDLVDCGDQTVFNTHQFVNTKTTQKLQA